MVGLDQGQNQPFLEYGHVAYYQIKANDACSNMIANVLPIDTSSTPRSDHKFKPYIFLKVVMLQIKEALAIKRIYSLVAMITKTKFSNRPNVSKIGLYW